MKNYAGIPQARTIQWQVQMPKKNSQRRDSNLGTYGDNIISTRNHQPLSNQAILFEGLNKKISHLTKSCDHCVAIAKTVVETALIRV